MNKKQKKLGITLVKSLHSISFKLPSIMHPTMIKAADVAEDGIADIGPISKSDKAKQAEVITLVNPVLPPDSIPAADST